VERNELWQKQKASRVEGSKGRNDFSFFFYDLARACDLMCACRSQCWCGVPKQHIKLCCISPCSQHLYGLLLKDHTILLGPNAEGSHTFQKHGTFTSLIVVLPRLKLLMLECADSVFQVVSVGFASIIDRCSSNGTVSVRSDS